VKKKRANFGGVKRQLGTILIAEKGRLKLRPLECRGTVLPRANQESRNPWGCLGKRGDLAVNTTERIEKIYCGNTAGLFRDSKKGRGDILPKTAKNP